MRPRPAVLVRLTRGRLGVAGFRLDDEATLRDRLTLQGDLYHGVEDAGGVG